MNMKQEVLRRCALTLHSLCPQDRRWLLDRLSVEQARDLERMLAELEAIGIPAEPDAVNATSRSQAASEAEPEQVGAPAALSTSVPSPRHASAGDLSAVLQQGLPGLIARFLRRCTPRQRQAVTAKWPLAERRMGSE
jgi:hypothetical protein